MTIKVSYNVTDVYVSETISATYINVSYEVPNDGGAVWGDITGTLSDQTDLQNALNAKVPYTGATTNVNLGEFELRAGQMTLDTSPTGTAAVGTTRWNDTIGSSETTLKGGSVILKNGVDLVARVVNKVSPNTTLTKAAYQAVRISGAQGQRLAVALAQANNDNNSADTIGLVTETIATNQEGFIMTVGSLESINTTGSLQGETWADGDVIYLSPTTAGRLTNIKPIAPQHIIIIGYVEYAHANNGKLYVKVMNGWELGELHDVDTTGATNGQVLKYNGTIWTPSSDVGITSLNGLNATTQTFATGSSGTDFNISSATSTHTFNLPTASATNRGALSSADWTTFNSKQNALTNPITGTGTSGQVAYFTGATTQAGEAGLTWDTTNKRLQFGTTGTRGYITYDGSDNTIFNIDSPSGRSFRVGSTDRNIQVSFASNIFRGAANIFQVANGAEAARFFSSTNFGIGTGATDSGQKLQVVGTGYFSDSVGIGNSGSVASSLRISKALATGNTIGIYMDSQIQSTLSNVAYFQSEASTSASAITVTNLRHFFATQPSVGAGSTITNQYGFFVQGTMTGATNDYAFYSDLAAGTNIWNLYMNGTANNYMAGSLGIGSTSLTGTTLNVSKNITGGTSTTAINSAGTIQSDVTGTTHMYLSLPATQAASFTLTNLFHYRAFQGTIGSGSSVSTQYGFHADSTLIGATNNFGFYGNIASGTNRWNLYMNGTALNYFNGNTLIGSTTDSGEKLQVIGSTYISDGLKIGPNALTTQSIRASRNMTGSTLVTSALFDAAIQSDVTGEATYINAATRTAAASFTIPSIVLFSASQTSIAAGSTVTNQYGFVAASSLTGATNNYGFFGNIASGTNRWNLYMGGTANNYMAGSLGIGQTTLTGSNLRISKAHTGSSSAINFYIDSTIQSDVTNSPKVIATTLSTQAAAFTVARATHYLANQGTIGAGSTITTQVGFEVDNTLIGATINYGFFGNIASGTNRWNLYMNGTADNYMAGRLGIGTTSPSATLTVFSSIVDAPSTTNKGAFQLAFSTTNGLSFGTYSTSPFANYIQTIAHAQGAGAIYPLSLQPIGGAVLIGASTSSGEALQVTGTAKITSKLSMGAGTTSNAQINLASSTAPTSPANGDIWFDGTDLKMRIGGVTKTFTLI
jgi:hypothetical protein